MNGDEFAIKVGKGAAYIFGGTFLGYIISFFYKIILARWLGPADFGVLSIALMVLSLLSIFSLGIPSAVVKYVSEKPSKSRVIFKTSLITMIVISAVISVALYLLSDFISFNIFKLSTSVPIKITAGILFFTIIQALVSGMTAGFQRMRDIAISEVMEKGSKVVATLILLYMGFGIYGVIFATGIGVLANLFFLSIRINKAVSGGSFDKVYLKKLILFGFPVFLGVVGGSLLSWTDTTFLGILTTTEAVGFYNAAVPIMWYLSVPIAALASSLFPAFSEISSKKNKILLNNILNRSIKYTIYILVPASIGVVLLSRYVILILYGPTFLEATKVLQFLSIGAFFAALSTILSMYLSGVGKPKLVMRSVVIAAIFNVLLSWLTISMYGLNGAGISTMVSTILMSMLLFRYVAQSEKINLSYVWKVIASTFIMSILLSIILFLDVRGIIKILVCVPLGVLVYTAIMNYVRAFDDFDYRVLKRVKDKLKKTFHLT